MTLTLPQLRNSQSSRLRLHGSNGQPGLSGMVDKPIPEDFNPDEISWVRPRIGITDWEGACEAIALNHYVITVAPEIGIGSDVIMGLEPYKFNFKSTLNKISNKIGEILDDTDQNVVLHCAMGMERAPLAVVWYLHKNEGLSIEDAYKDVIQARPIACNREKWLTWI
jgi:hypothetical protein